MPLHVDGVPAGLSPDRTVLNNGAYGQVSAIVELAMVTFANDIPASEDWLAAADHSVRPVGIVRLTLARYPQLDGQYSWVGRAEGDWNAVAQGDVIRGVRVEE